MWVFYWVFLCVDENLSCHWADSSRFWLLFDRVRHVAWHRVWKVYRRDGFQVNWPKQKQTHDNQRLHLREKFRFRLKATASWILVRQLRCTWAWTSLCDCWNEELTAKTFFIWFLKHTCRYITLWISWLLSTSLWMDGRASPKSISQDPSFSF